MLRARERGGQGVSVRDGVACEEGPWRCWQTAQLLSGLKHKPASEARHMVFYAKGKDILATHVPALAEHSAANWEREKRFVH